MKLIAKILILSALLSALWSCKQTEYVTVPIHDTTYTVREVHDSTFIDRWHTHTVSGDTVFIHDSIYESHVEWKHDTMKVVEEKPVEVPVVKEVEKELSWLQRTLIYIGMGALIAVVIKLAWNLLKKYLGR